jgi:hypothetical protein
MLTGLRNLITAEELAKRLNVMPITVSRLRKFGILQTVQVGRHHRYDYCTALASFNEWSERFRAAC